MTALSEQELLSTAFQRLTDLLTEVQAQLRRYPSNAIVDSGHDAVWQVEAHSYTAQLIVQAFRRFTPRDVDRVVAAVALLRRVAHHPTIVVVAPWFSARSQQALTDRGLNYLDLTGNVHIRIVQPTILIRLTGASEDPDPPSRPPVRLQGTNLIALIRTLVDVTPPYRMVDLARATGLSNAYVSRTLDALDDEGLVKRDPRSREVVDVDWRNLLLARVTHYDLFKRNRAQTFLARTGAAALYPRLIGEDQAVVTGSFAAYELVPVAVPSQLAIYVPNTATFVEQYELVRAQHGANVVLLNAAAPAQLWRVRQLPNGTHHAAVSQVALDCLAGNGRLPEEGEALLKWMSENLPAWRAPQLPASRNLGR